MSLTNNFQIPFFVPTSFYLSGNISIIQAVASYFVGSEI